MKLPFPQQKKKTLEAHHGVLPGEGAVRLGGGKQLTTHPVLPFFFHGNLHPYLDLFLENGLFL